MIRKSLGLLLLSFVTSILFSISLIFADKHGAGIVPYCKNNQGDIYFLLGVDCHRPESWTDFGGGAGHHHDNKNASRFLARDKYFAKKAAAKEGHEETMGVFSNCWQHPIRDKARGEFFFERKLKSNHSVSYTFPNGSTYTTFFVNVTQAVKDLGHGDFDTGKRNSIIYLNKQRNFWNRRRQNGRIEYAPYIEKTIFSWFSLEGFMNGLNTIWQKERDGSQKAYFSGSSGLVPHRHPFYHNLIKNINQLHHCHGGRRDFLQRLQ